MTAMEQAVELVLPNTAKLDTGAELTKPPPLLGGKGYTIVDLNNPLSSSTLRYPFLIEFHLLCSTLALTLAFS
jgi:hypothetical protein